MYEFLWFFFFFRFLRMSSFQPMARAMFSLLCFYSAALIRYSQTSDSGISHYVSHSLKWIILLTEWIFIHLFTNILFYLFPHSDFCQLFTWCLLEKGKLKCKAQIFIPNGWSCIASAATGLHLRIGCIQIQGLGMVYSNNIRLTFLSVSPKMFENVWLRIQHFWKCKPQTFRLSYSKTRSLSFNIIFLALTQFCSPCAWLFPINCDLWNPLSLAK